MMVNKQALYKPKLLVVSNAPGLESYTSKEFINKNYLTILIRFSVNRFKQQTAIVDLTLLFSINELYINI